ncbi:MAG: hypothetical protein R2779_04945 [Crocinitomicaceae bacterium]
MTIRFLNEIVGELNDFGTVNVDENQTIICVVGTFEMDATGYAAQIFEGIKHLPIHADFLWWFQSQCVIQWILKTKQSTSILHNHLF